MPADLHVHSRASDGSLTLREILARALELGLDSVGLADHDSTAHLDQAEALGLDMGVRVIPSVEISAKDNRTGGSAHILGYFLRSESPAVEELCAPILEQRGLSTLKALEEIQARGVRIDKGDVERAAYTTDRNGSLLDHSPVLYRQHLFAALRAIGYTENSIRDLRETLYGPGGPCFGGIDYPDAEDAIRAILEDGGIPVLAHPGSSGCWDAIPRLVKAGLRGIEENHPAHTPTDRKRARAFCERFRLVRTGGSDNHGGFDEDPSQAARVGAPEALCPNESAAYFTRSGGRELLFAEGLALEMGAFLRSHRARGQRPIASALKGGDHGDLVSECDLAVDAAARRRISKAFPKDGLLTEEGKPLPPPPKARVWILDPVDGTTNFLRKGREYTVSLALWEGLNPILGIVYDVHADVLYRCAPGTGIAANGVPVDPKPTAPSNKGPVAELDPLNTAILDASLNTITAFQGRGTDIRRLSERLRGHRSLGCASLAILRVALGELDAFASDRLRVWDWAAGVVFLAEAGGAWTGLFGAQADPYDERPTPFLACRSMELLGAFLEAFAPERASVWRSSSRITRS